MAKRSGATSNLQSLSSALEDLENACDFDRPGSPNGRIGDDIAYIAGNIIQERTFNQQLDGDGNQIEPNRGRYGEAKRDRGLPVGIGFSDRGDDGPKMLDIAQVVGTTNIQPKEMTQAFGTLESSQNKGRWFETGNDGRNQPPRPFYDLDDEIIDKIMDHIGERVSSTLRGD